MKTIVNDSSVQVINGVWTKYGHTIDELPVCVNVEMFVEALSRYPEWALQRAGVRLLVETALGQLKRAKLELNVDEICRLRLVLFDAAVIMEKKFGNLFPTSEEPDGRGYQIPYRKSVKMGGLNFN